MLCRDCLLMQQCAFLPARTSENPFPNEEEPFSESQEETVLRWRRRLKKGHMQDRLELLSPDPLKDRWFKPYALTRHRKRSGTRARGRKLESESEDVTPDDINAGKDV